MSLYIEYIWLNMIQASLGLLYDARVLLNLDTFTNPERFFLVLVLILLFIHTLHYFSAISHGLFIFDVVITTLGLDVLGNYL